MHKRLSLTPFALTQLIVLGVALIWPWLTWNYGRVISFVPVYPVRIAPDFIVRRAVILPEPNPVPTSPPPTPTPKPTPGSPAASQLLRAPSAGSVVSLKQMPAPPQDSSADPSNPPLSSSPSLTPTRILVPAVGLDAPIVVAHTIDYEYAGQPATTWEVPDWYAVGWHENSAPPAEPGNTVLNGHRNVYGSVFRDLGELQVGDEIVVYAGETAYHYWVVHQQLFKETGQALEVRAQNARLLLPTYDRRLTLVTCAPLTRSTHRLITVAVPTRMETPASDAH